MPSAKSNPADLAWCCPLAVPEMADPSKRQIYGYLANDGEKTVTEITRRLKLTQPTVSYHLKIMKARGLLWDRKEGRQVYYSAKMLCNEGGLCFGGTE